MDGGDKAAILTIAVLVGGVLIVGGVVGAYRHLRRSITDSIIDERHRHFFHLLFFNAAVAVAVTIVGLEGCPGQNDNKFNISGMLLARLLLETVMDMLYMAIWLAQLNYWSQAARCCCC